MKKLFLLSLLLALLIVPSLAQDETNLVEIESTDGLILQGDYLLPENLESPAPAVILLHMLSSNRAAYAPLIPSLLEAGYIVLNMDMRGHGATRGQQNWELAESDVQVMFDWLHEQEEVDDTRVAIIGASIGSNLALLGCANDTSCVTAIALSPGEDYRGVQPMPAVESGLNALLIASHSDNPSAGSVRNFFSSATGTVAARMYEGRAHGTQLFDNQLDSMTETILLWLDEQFAAVVDNE